MSLERIPDEARERVRVAVARLLKQGETKKTITIKMIQDIAGVSRKRCADLRRAYVAGDLPSPGAVKSGAGAWAVDRGGATSSQSGDSDDDDLATLVAEAEDEDALQVAARAVAAAITRGTLDDKRGGAVQRLIAEQRQLLKAKRGVPQEDPERIYLVSPDGAVLVDAFERICDPGRRARVMRFVQEELEADIEALPSVDPVGGLTA